MRDNFKQFTNLYSLSKTLRFELKPVGRTRDTFKQWLEELKNTECVVDNDSNLFVKDKKIKEAYLALKPIMDKLHEQFIDISLTSEEAKKIDFSEYFEVFNSAKEKSKKKRKDEENTDEDNKEQKKNITDIENDLRKKIAETYEVSGNYYSKKIGEVIKKVEEEKKKGKKSKTKDEKPKNQKTKNPYECLTDAKMYNYLLANAKDLAKQNDIDEELLAKHIEQFKGFWGYLTGYNQNRENYYEVKKEASTAVATRIVHENLPKFCNNISRFENRKDEYLAIYQYLKDNNRETKIKDLQGNEYEAKPIAENIFQIKHFNECLAQSQIEEYNRIIGNYNLLINLYNQARRSEKEFRKIDEFEKLYKQIGCGKKKTMFETLHDDNDVKNLLEKANEAGKEMFKTGSNSLEIKTVPDLITFLKDCDNWDGIYMSKTAISKISDLYFANWHSIKDKLKEAKADACITFDKNREEQIQLRDVVELSGLFAILDTEQSEHFFKESLFKDDETNAYRGVLDKALPPSKNIINLLCFDIERNMNAFLKESDSIVALEKYKDDNIQAGEEDQTIKKIKEWFDAATDAMSIVRYFAVRKSKMKGNVPNVTMELALSNLLYSDEAQWFKWYDLIRNYLTKKLQDDAKENKLKLNFGKGKLLGGWVDSKTENSDNGTQYGGYLFRKRNEINEYDYYLGISSDVHLFRKNTELPLNDKSEYERLDYYQMKSSTPYPNDYGNKKDEIIDIVKKLANDNEELVKWIENNDKDNKLTPTKLFEKLEKSNDPILKNKELLGKVGETISIIKSNLKNFTRIDAINDLQNDDKNHSGIDGFKKLIDELKKITEETKLFDYFPVSSSEFNTHNGVDLFLFKISNKDLSFAETFTKKKRKSESRGLDNLHTMYFKSMMEGNQNVFDIGTGEIFLRKKVFEYDDIVWKQGHHYEELKNKFDYPIISKKRFAEDKFQLHLSIKQNYAPGIKPSQKGYQQKQINEINSKITDALQQSDNLQFIGIDRGEKHLVYSCTIDKDSKIIKCNHHDNINGTDYVQKLEAVADDRIIAKKNWQAQNKIKDLKSGYISHVVHRLVEETIKDGEKIAPHAYIVLEDLSTEMKRGRQKIEKSIYQNLETALAKKLNFVVDKTAKQGELGSVSKALQLTPPISSYKDDIKGKKQIGVMLYTRANYTSVTDPATGWRKTIYIKNGSEENIKTQILEKFSDFGFDGKDYYFEYTEAHAGHTWRMYSGKDGEALLRFRNSK